MGRLAEWSLIIVGNPLQSVFEHRLAEIDKQAKRELHQAQIGEHLPAVHRSQPFDGFQFNNQTIVDEQINLECVVHDNAFEIHLDRDLASDLMSCLHQGSRQQTFIRMFKQARTQGLMNLKTKIDDIVGDRFQSIWLQHLRVLRVFV